MKNTTEYLMQLGLSESQAKSLEALLGGRDLTAKEISEATGSPHTKIYEVLKVLEQRGLVESTFDKPRLYRSFKPDVLIQKLIDTQEAGLKEIKQGKTEILDQLTTGYKIDEKQRMEPHVWFFHGTDAIFSEVADIITGAKDNLKYVGSITSYRLWLSNARCMNEMYNAIRRGITVHALVSPKFKKTDVLSLAPKLASKHWYKILYLLKSKNMHFRVAPHQLEVNYMIRDNEEFSTAYPDEHGHVKYGIRFQDQSIAKFMTNYYDALWEKGTPFGKPWWEKK